MHAASNPSTATHSAPGGLANRRVRLLLTISDLIGRGAEREFAALAARLDRSRFDTRLVFWRDRFDYPPPADLPREVLDKQRPWQVLRTIRRMADAIDRHRPDVVFSQLHYVSMVTGSALARSRHRPAWVCRLVNDPRRDMPWPWLVWARRSLARAACVAGCSQGVTRAAVEHLKLDASRCQTLTNVVDVEAIVRQAASGEPPAPADRFVFLFLGTLSRQKRPDLAVEALAQLLARRPDSAELWLAGTGPLGQDLGRQVAARGVGPFVRFLGFQPNPHVVMRSAGALVLSSDSEGLPNAIIEAQLVGLPVIATRCPFGPDELVRHQQTGLLVPAGNAAALSQAMEQVLDQPTERARWAAAAADEARRRFDPQAVVGQYEALFLQCAGRTGVSGS